MVILFLVAVLLAIPTAGLSLLAYFALLVGQKYLEKSQSRADYAEQLAATRSASNAAVRHAPPRPVNRYEPPRMDAAKVTNLSTAVPSAEESAAPSSTAAEITPKTLEEAVLLSFKNGGAPRRVAEVSDFDAEILFVSHLHSVTPIVQKDESVTGRAGWIMLGTEYYLVGVACIGGHALVWTFPQAIPLMSAITIRGDHDTSRLQSAQHDWFMEFFPTVRNMVQSTASGRMD